MNFSSKEQLPSLLKLFENLKDCEFDIKNLSEDNFKGVQIDVLSSANSKRQITESIEILKLSEKVEIKTEYAVLKITYYLNKHGNDIIKISNHGNYSIVIPDTKGYRYNSANSSYVIYSPDNIYISVKKKFFPSNIPDFNISQITINFLKIYTRENPFFLDLIESYEKDSFLPTRKFSDCLKYHTKKDMLESFRKYKKLNIPKSINRRTIKECVKICDIAINLPEKDRYRIFNADTEFLAQINNTASFVESIWRKNGMDLDSEDRHTVDIIIDDYLSLSLHMNRDIQLNKKSWKKVVEMHNELAIEYRAKHMKTIKIPKNSKFNKLILPAEYERIKTKERLAEESIIQHHCVATYDEYINQDICSIYSYVASDGGRYTIEIIKNKSGNFICRQFLGICNSFAPETEVEKLENILKIQNEGKKKPRY